MHLRLGEPDAPPQFVEQFFRRHARDLHEVLLLDTIPGVSEEIREPAIVGEQDQPLAHPIEPADREQPLLTRHQIDDPGPARRIDVGGDDAHGLVEHVDNPLRVWQPLAIDADLLGLRINPRAERGDDLAIHFHASRCDQRLAGPPAAEPGRREHLLQPLQAVVGDDELRGCIVPLPAEWPAPPRTSRRRRLRAARRRSRGVAVGRPGIGGWHVTKLSEGAEAGRRAEAGPCREPEPRSYTASCRQADHRAGCDHQRDRFTSGTGSA